MDLNYSEKGCYINNFFNVNITNIEPLKNQHPWENLNINGIYLFEMVSCLLIGEIYKKQKLFNVNFIKTPIHNGQKWNILVNIWINREYFQKLE